MAGKANYITAGAGLFLALVISYLYFSLQPMSETMEMEVESPGVTRQESIEYIETAVKQMDIVLWKESEKECYNEDEKSARCTVISKVGDARLIFPQASFLDDHDHHGCILSKKAAYAIWGSEAVAGFFIYCGEERYIVRGVADLPEKLVLINAPSGETDTLSYLSSGKRGGTIQEKKQWLQTETGINGNVWNYYMLNQFLLCLIIFDIILIIIFFKRRIAVIAGTSRGKTFLEILFSVFLMTGIACLTIEALTINGWPAKWSDFQQWKEKAGLMGETVQFFLRSKKPLAVIWKLKYYIMALSADIAAVIVLSLSFVFKFRKLY